MITFWVVAVCLLIAVVALLAVPLARRHALSVGVDQDRSNVELFHDQLTELERDRDQGLLSSEQFELARIELSQRLLADVSAPAQAQPAPHGARTGTWRYAVLACVPVVTVLGYLAIGTPEALDGDLARPQNGLPPGHAENLGLLAERLAARLAEKPDDVEAWVLLARSYQRLGRASDAAKAFARAVELAPNSAQVHADHADALVGAANGQWTPAALSALERALSIDPVHPKALWLAGTEAYLRKDYPSALRHWEKLAPLIEPGSEVAQIIQSNLAEVRALMAGSPAAPSGSTQPQRVPPKAVAGDTPEAGPKLTGTVMLDPKLQAQVKPTDAVFVFARAVQGPKLPLAIRRITVQELPYTFLLDDSAAMAPGMVISKFDQVVVGARISRSGDATPKPGDLEGFSPPVKPGTEGIRVQIDARVE